MGKIDTWIRLTLLVFLATSCLKNADLTGMIYTGQPVDNRIVESLAFNNSNGYHQIITSDDTYSIFFMGDSHVGGTTNLETFFQDAQDEAAKAVVLCGDLVTGHEEDYLLFYDKLPHFDTLPYFPVAGNHDLYFKGWQFYRQLFGTSTYYFTVQTPSGTDLFIGLDTGSGTLGKIQLDWLTELLKTKRSLYRNCVVFTHVNIFRNYFDTSASPMLDENYKFIELMTLYNVQFVIQGHSHKQAVDHFGHTTYLVMDALKDGNPKAGYLKLNISTSGISYNFHRLF